MFNNLDLHPKLRISEYGEDFHARLNKRLPPDLNQITLTLIYWIKKTLSKWEVRSDNTQERYSARMFYEDKIFRNNTMFRLLRFRNKTSFHNKLVLARIYMSETAQNKGYFSQLLNKLEEIATQIHADLSIECANNKLSSILLAKNYLLERNKHCVNVQMPHSLAGTWIWPKDDRTYRHNLICTPTSLMDQIRQQRSLCTMECDAVIDEELHIAFSKIAARLATEVEPLSRQRKNELEDLRRRLPASSNLHRANQSR